MHATLSSSSPSSSDFLTAKNTVFDEASCDYFGIGCVREGPSLPTRGNPSSDPFSLLAKKRGCAVKRSGTRRFDRAVMRIEISLASIRITANFIVYRSYTRGSMITRVNRAYTCALIEYRIRVASTSEREEKRCE